MCRVWIFGFCWLCLVSGLGAESREILFVGRDAQNPAHQPILAGMQAAMDAQGHIRLSVVDASAARATQEAFDEALRAAALQTPAGLVIDGAALPSQTSLLEGLRQAGIPWVSYGTPDATLPLDRREVVRWLAVAAARQLGEQGSVGLAPGLEELLPSLRETLAAYPGVQIYDPANRLARVVDIWIWLPPLTEPEWAAWQRFRAAHQAPACVFGQHPAFLREVASGRIPALLMPDLYAWGYDAVGQLIMQEEQTADHPARLLLVTADNLAVHQALWSRWMQ